MESNAALPSHLSRFHIKGRLPGSQHKSESSRGSSHKLHGEANKTCLFELKLANPRRVTGIPGTFIILDSDRFWTSLDLSESAQTEMRFTLSAPSLVCSKKEIVVPKGKRKSTSFWLSTPDVASDLRHTVKFGKTEQLLVKTGGYQRSFDYQVLEKELKVDFSEPLHLQHKGTSRTTSCIKINRTPFTTLRIFLSGYDLRFEPNVVRVYPGTTESQLFQVYTTSRTSLGKASVHVVAENEDQDLMLDLQAEVWEEVPELDDSETSEDGQELMSDAISYEGGSSFDGHSEVTEAASPFTSGTIEQIQQMLPFNNDDMNELIANQLLDRKKNNEFLNRNTDPTAEPTIHIRTNTSDGVIEVRTSKARTIEIRSPQGTIDIGQMRKGKIEVTNEWNKTYVNILEDKRDLKPLVLVTNATSFVGSYLVKYLIRSEDFRVRGTCWDLNSDESYAVKRLFPELELVEVDILSVSDWQVALESCSYLVHVSYAHGMVEMTRVESMKALCQAAYANEVPNMVYVGTVIYDDWGSLSRKITGERKAEYEMRRFAEDHPKMNIATVMSGICLGSILMDHHEIVCIEQDADGIDFLTSIFDMKEDWVDGFEMLTDVRDVTEVIIALLNRLNVEPKRWKGKRIWCVATTQTYEATGELLRGEFEEFGYQFPRKKRKSWSCCVCGGSSRRRKSRKKNRNKHIPQFFYPNKILAKQLLKSGQFRAWDIPLISMAHEMIYDGFLETTQLYSQYTGADIVYKICEEVLPVE